MATVYNEFDVQLINARTGNPIDDDSGIFGVYAAATPDEVTIFDNKFTTTAGSNPGTMTDGRITFYTANTTTTVDISGITASGIPFFIESLTLSQHRVEIDVDKYTGMKFILPFSFATTGSVAIHDTGFDLSVDNIVHPNIQVVITTAGADTSDFFQIGTSTDLSAWLAAVKTSTTGTKLQIHSTDLSHAVTATISAIQLGTALLLSVTAQDDFTPVQIANATSGARIAYKDVSATAATVAGYAYIELDRVIV